MKNLFGKIASVGRWPGGSAIVFWEGDVGGMAGVALLNQSEWRVWLTSPPLQP